MKKIVFLLAILYYSSSSAQQWDLLLSNVNNDTVTIIDSNAWRNCAMFNVWDFYINDYQIDLYERDTATGCAVCYCFFDFKVTLAGLNSGTYTANIYQFYMDSICGSDTTYIGSVIFTINAQTFRDSVIIIEEYTNDCHEIVNVSEISNAPFISSFPNPVADDVTISYSLPTQIDKGIIILYNLFGEKIKQIEVDKSFDRLHISTSDLAPGAYYYQLQTKGQNSDGKKLIVIK